MHWLLWIVITLGTFALMEAITWATHKYVMHGFLWYLHEDHHKPRGHVFEKNDAGCKASNGLDGLMMASMLLPQAHVI